MAEDTTRNTGVHMAQGGNELDIGAAGTLRVYTRPLSEYGNGAVVSGKCTAVEYGSGVVHQTVLTLSLTGTNDLDLADGADHGTGVKIYDFPEGRILLLGATINGVTTIAGASGGGATLPLALGTVTAADDATLTGTEVNIIPSTATANGSSTFKAALAAQAQFDGTSAAVDVYFNAAVTNAVSASAVTIAVTGTVTLTWINLGDY
jgi:hypothetical protein